MAMTPAEISIATTRLMTDVLSLSKNVGDAVSAENTDLRDKAWRASADSLGSVVSDLATLAKNDPTWGKLLGGASTVDALSVSLDKALDSYKKSGNINDVKVGDMLGVMGGVSDLGGGLLVKPGPQFMAGIALKGIGLGAAMGQNAIDDELTIGQLIGASPSSAPTEAPSTAMEVVITASRIKANDVADPNGLGSNRNSASYITDTGANDHLAVINQGGTLSDLWVLQKNSATGFTNAQDFYAAVLASNPGITDVNHIAAGQTVYLPEKMSDGSITYNYAGGASVNSNATTGEYHMVVPNAEGGQTIYSRTVDGEAGYVVKQVSTNTEGATTLDYSAHQATLDSEIKEFTANTSVYDANNHLSSQTKTEVFYDDNGEQSRIETVTDNSGTVRNVYDNEGQLFKSEQVNTGANSLSYAVGATASFLSLVKAIQTGKPLPIATTGVNTLVALQSINGKANTVLSGTGAALSTLTKTFGPDSVITNVAISACNDETWRVAA